MRKFAERVRFVVVAAISDIHPGAIITETDNNHDNSPRGLGNSFQDHMREMSQLFASPEPMASQSDYQALAASAHAKRVY